MVARTRAGHASRHHNMDRSAERAQDAAALQVIATFRWSFATPWTASTRASASPFVQRPIARTSCRARERRERIRAVQQPALRPPRRHGRRRADSRPLTAGRAPRRRQIEVAACAGPKRFGSADGPDLLPVGALAARSTEGDRHPIQSSSSSWPLSRRRVRSPAPSFDPCPPRISCLLALRWHSTHLSKSRMPSSMCSRRMFSVVCSWQP